MSDGFVISASWVSSMPTTATSWGTERPSASAPCMVATASRSLAARIASGLAWARSTSVARQAGLVREVVGGDLHVGARRELEPVDRVEVAGETGGARHRVDRDR